MKTILLLLFFSTGLWANDFKQVLANYSQGKYQSVVDELDEIQKQSGLDHKAQGLIHYWKGMANNRLQNFPAAIDSFSAAIRLKYDAEDLNYEYGQALFAADKLKRARKQFRKSFNKGFKKGVCLYYIAYIYKDLGKNLKAKSLFEGITRLPDAEKVEVHQAAQLQINDIDLEEAQKSKHSISLIENEVIPAYEKTLKLDPDSVLAPRIQQKIIGLQRKYELVLFELRNGRPTTFPPYFLRVAQEIGLDTNVTFTPAETTVAKAKQESPFTKTEAMGRYTFYPTNYISLAPEFRTNYSRYYNRIPEIYRNDNYLLAPAIRLTYEHKAFEKPASVLADFDYNYAGRDVNSEQKLVFSSRAYLFTLGERFSFFERGPSTIRLRHRIFDSFLDASDAKAWSLILEQLVTLPKGTLIFYSSLDRTRTIDESFSTNAATIRLDWLMPQLRDWFTPSVGLGLTFTDPINNREARGIEKMVNPNIRLTRRFGRNWGLNYRAEYQRSYSRDKQSFAFQKYVTGLELEYLF